MSIGYVIRFTLYKSIVFIIIFLASNIELSPLSDFGTESAQGAVGG